MRWDQIRSIGKYRFLKAVLIFPFLPLIINILSITDIFDTLAWNILLLYYGTNCIALSIGLYILFCPNPIKQYSSPVEFYNVEINYITEAKKVKIYNEIIKAGYSLQSSPSIIPTQDIIDIYYEYLSNTKKILRVIISIFCLLGFSLITIPTFIKLYQMLIATINFSKS